MSGSKVGLLGLLHPLCNAICQDDIESVKQYCEGKSLKGTFSPSLLSLALLRSHPNNIEMVSILTKAGLEPTAHDFKTYQALPESIKPSFADVFKAKISFSKRLRSWSQKSSLSSKQVAKLWEGACERNDPVLSDYLLSHYSFSRSQIQNGLDIAKAKSHQELLRSLAQRTVLTRPEKQELLLDATAKGHTETVAAIIQDWLPKKRGFFAGIKHRVAQFFSNIRYGHSSSVLKEALFLALEKQERGVVETLLQAKQLTFSSSENDRLWEFLSKNLSNSSTLIQKYLAHPEIELGYCWRVGEDSPICAVAVIWEALNQGHLEAARQLLQDKRINPAHKDNKALRLAAEKGYLEIIKLLLTDPRVDPSAKGDEALRVAVKNGHVGIVKLLLADPRVDPSARGNEAIRCAVENGHTEMVKLLLADSRVDPSAWDNESIRVGVKKGYVEIVKLLLANKRVDPSAWGNEAMRNALEEGHVEIIKLLLADPRVDPSVSYNKAIRWAVKNGYTEMVKLLLADPRVDPSVGGNEAIRVASAKGYSGIVKLLLVHPKVDPSASYNDAIREASLKGHIEVVKLLLTDKRVDPSERSLILNDVAKNGHAKVITALLKDPRIDPTLWGDSIIKEALGKSDLKMIQALSRDLRVNIINDPEALAQIVDLSVTQRNFYGLKRILEKQQLKLTTFDHQLCQYAINTENAYLGIVLSMFLPETMLSQIGKLGIESVNILFTNHSLKKALKKLEAESFVTIHSNGLLIECVELLLTSSNQEEFRQALTCKVYEKSIYLLEDNLLKAAKIFHPLIASRRLFPTLEGEFVTDVKKAVFPFYLAPKLAPFLPTDLARDFFKILSDQISTSPEGYIQKSIDIMTGTYVNKAVDIITSTIDQSKLPAKSWVQKHEEKMKDGVSVVCK